MGAAQTRRRRAPSSPVRRKLTPGSLGGVGGASAGSNVFFSGQGQGGAGGEAGATSTANSGGSGLARSSAEATGGAWRGERR